jgi:hypothetical protein
MFPQINLSLQRYYILKFFCNFGKDAKDSWKQLCFYIGTAVFSAYILLYAVCACLQHIYK